MALAAFPQVSIGTTMEVAVAGMQFQASDADSIEALIAEEAIPAGAPVSTGTGGTIWDSCEIPDSAAEIAHLRGIALYNSGRMPNAASANQYAAGDMVDVLKNGRVYIAIVGTIAPDAAVYVGNTGAFLGKFYPDTQSGSATIVAGLKCVHGGTDTLVLIDVRLPAP